MLVTVCACVCVCVVITGTRPMPELWKRWNFAYLDPPDSLKTIQQEDNEALKLNKTSQVT